MAFNKGRKEAMKKRSTGKQELDRADGIREKHINYQLYDVHIHSTLEVLDLYRTIHTRGIAGTHGCQDHGNLRNYVTNTTSLQTASLLYT
jgi:hypothetical protein